MNMNYSHIIFDLDGTLIDSTETFRFCLEYALEKMNYPEPKVADVNPLIGPPILRTFQDVFGFTLSEAKQGYRYYLEEYVDNGRMYKTPVYPGVKETLHSLSEQHYFLGVATTKNETNARKIIKGMAFDIEIDRVYGTYNDGTRSNKKEIITDLLTDHHIRDLSNVLMVGDRYYDIVGASEVGIDSVGVTYGCGSMEELKEAGATRLIASFSELLEIV
ncbi:HAD hydrolase-like protein [Acetobacterium fimetarium]|uniref:HAD hydrolase-like protein n=1 Tax=Acetobacterium fimetarium TaxID=52691 RepID=A0ABR6WXI6_9FIRM|nr:HAD hydrolase-like protein [Acetobacterium fimetarium]MBC3804961.1 HAD hydrolase-like protein [Acetobacterium fimetarium]